MSALATITHLPDRPALERGALSGQSTRWLLTALLLAFIARAWLMVRLPLADTTEARYGEIARVMLDTKAWLMPHADPQTPFFAKPPLSTWTEAIAVEAFGLHEWALRLPALIATASMLAFMWLAMRGAAREVRIKALCTAGTAPLVWVSAGAVMTDATQLACVVGAMWCATNLVFANESPSRVSEHAWSLGFGGFVGVGLLAKGLATVALIGLPMAAYAVVSGRIIEMCKRLITLRSVSIALAIAGPWYWAAEWHYPGFLRYFILGEHFARFVDPGWQGDRYGRAHAVPIGTIWLFACAAMAPWLPIVVTTAMSNWRDRRSGEASDSRVAWWWCWCLTPLVFFTFTRNLIWTYALTAIPPCAILIARARPRPRLEIACAFVALALALAALLMAPSALDPRSARDLVAAAQPMMSRSKPIVVEPFLEFSTAFYTRGASRVVRERADLIAALRTPGQLAIVHTDELDALNAQVPVDTIASNPHAALIRSK